MPITTFLQLLDTVTHLRVGGNIGRTVNLGSNLFHLLPQRITVFVDESRARFLVAQINHDARHLSCTSTAVGPVRCHHHLDTKLGDTLGEQIHFSLGVCGKTVDRNNTRNAIDVFHVMYMTL